MENTKKNTLLLPDELPIFGKPICNQFNELPLNDYSLAKNRIDIWQYPLHKEHPFANKILSAKEQERASRFYFSKHKRRFSVAHTTLRLILSRYLKNKNPSELEFTENKYGKPKLINNNHLEFNLSHSGDLALLAIGQYLPLGVDLEFFTDRPYLDIGNNMFSKIETKSLNKTHKNLQALIFFRIWAQKEAFIKASGLGLSYPTTEFTVSHQTAYKNKIFDKKENKFWHLTTFMPTIACAGAICHDPSINDIRYLILDKDFELTR